MTAGYISFADARAAQAEELQRAIPPLVRRVGELAGTSLLAGPGPIFVGIGASHAAAAPAVWSLRERGIEAFRLSAGDQPLPYPRGVHPVIGISQSGRSTETVSVLGSVADELRAAVVNVEPSPVAAITTTIVGLGNIADSYASTIGFTATIAALGILADAWAGGRIDESWTTLPDAVSALERELEVGTAELSGLFADAEYADVVADARSAGTAEAGALLLREVARVPSTGMSTRQYLHGSMESAGAGVHLVFGGERELELAQVLSAAGHRTVFVTSAPVSEPGFPVLRLPARPVAQQAILEAIVLQHVAARAAADREVDIEEFVFHNSDTKIDASAQAGA